MTLSPRQPCEICQHAEWEIILENRGPSVCAGRELVQGGRPLRGKLGVPAERCVYFGMPEPALACGKGSPA